MPPAESALTEDPGLSITKEAAEVVPAESVSLKRKSIVFIHKIPYETVPSHIYFPTQKSLIFCRNRRDLTRKRELINDI